MKPNNVIYVKCTKDSFYRMWVEVLRPFHKLTARECDVAARIIAQYFRLKDNKVDTEVLYDVLWSHKSREDMRTSLKMSQAHFQMTLAKLKKVGFLIDDTINPRYISHKTDDPRFMLQVVFDWSSAQNPIRNGQE